MDNQTYVFLFYGIVGFLALVAILSGVIFYLVRRHYKAKFSILAHRLSTVSYQKEVDLAITREHDRISQVIHDEVGNKLIALLYEFERHFQQGTFGENGSDMLWQLSKQLKDRIRDTRALVRTFSSSELNSSGIVTDLDHFCKNKDGYQGVTVTLAGLSGARRFDLKREKELVAMVKELVYNSLKYSGCWHIDVALTWTKDGLIVEVSDDGYGLSKPGSRDYKISGLAGMRERCIAIDAIFKVEQPERGSRVLITLLT